MPSAGINLAMVSAVLVHSMIAAGAVLVFGSVGLFAVLFAALGAVAIGLIASGRAEAGLRLFMLSCAPFVPVGVLGVVGAWQMLDRLHGGPGLARASRVPSGV